MQRIEEAIRIWNEILAMDPDDERALSYVRRAEEAAQKAKQLSSGD